MCRNSNRRFSGRSEALRHAELHLAGLIVNTGEEEEDSDSTSGGFSSDHDCLSTDEEHDSDLSSVSERETEESDHNEEEGEDDNLSHVVGNNVVRKLLLYNYQQVFVNYSKCVKSFQMLE